jgi:hypothetical protein
MFNGISEYLIGKLLGASVGFVLISLIFIPASVREGLIRFFFFIASVVIFTKPILNHFGWSHGIMDVSSAAGIAGISAWIFASLGQIMSGYSLSEIAQIASIVRTGKRNSTDNKEGK